MGVSMRFVHSNQPEVVHTEKSTLPVPEWILSSCPSLNSPFNPSWYLPSIISGLSHTVFCLAGKFDSYTVDYQRHSLSLDDGGTIGIDVQPAVRDGDKQSDLPLVIILHGLSGGSDEAYVRSVVHDLVKKSFRCAVVNFRGCGNVPVTSAQLYSAGTTDDLRSAICYLRSIFPESSMSALGFSLGANVLVKYLNEEGSNTPILSACVVGNPWDLSLGTSVLESSPGKIISRVLALRLRSLMLKLHKTYNLDQYHTPDQRKRFVQLNETSLIPMTLKEFDSLITCKMGGPPPVWPMADADEYYLKNSSISKLNNLSVPLLSFTAVDDPVCPVISVPVGEDSKWLVQCLSEQGGHLGFFEGGSALSWLGLGQSPSRWYERPILELIIASKQLPPKIGKIGKKDWKSVSLSSVRMQ